jgi:hypothetical protein
MEEDDEFSLFLVMHHLPGQEAAWRHAPPQ